MIFYKNSKWNLCKEKIRYIQHDKEIEQYVGVEGHDWWIDFAEKWEHTTIIEFIPVEPTGERLQRLEEINQLNVSEGFGALVEDYVKEGIFPNGYNHPLAKLKLEKENKNLKQAIGELTVLLGGIK